MSFDMRIASTPILMPNPELRRQFEEYAREMIARLDRPDRHTASVVRSVLARLDDPKLSIRTVAREMAMSVRTLQKRLGEEGVAFSDLLRDVREELAKKYLREDYSVEQITYLLGYSDPSAFRKAFKKWTGATPREYRIAADGRADDQDRAAGR